MLAIGVAPAIGAVNIPLATKSEKGAKRASDFCAFLRFLWPPLRFVSVAAEPPWALCG
jgi:hypothetical protein